MPLEKGTHKGEKTSHLFKFQVQNYDNTAFPQHYLLWKYIFLSYPKGHLVPFHTKYLPSSSMLSTQKKKTLFLFFKPYFHTLLFWPVQATREVLLAWNYIFDLHEKFEPCYSNAFKDRPRPKTVGKYRIFPSSSSLVTAFRKFFRESNSRARIDLRSGGAFEGKVRSGVESGPENYSAVLSNEDLGELENFFPSSPCEYLFWN